MGRHEAARLEEKARLAAKRVSVAAKRAQRAELNLAENSKVSLNGVDVGQYTVILAGLEPVRLHVLERVSEELAKDLRQIADLLLTHGYNVWAANPADYHLKPKGWDRQVAFDAHVALDARIRRWYVVGYDGVATLRPDNFKRIGAEARATALEYVQGYAAKLAVKTGEYLAEHNLTAAGDSGAVLGCVVSSTDLWHNSIATIRVGHGLIGFHTQMIWNRSCLGKSFNQYPTRRLD